MVGDLLLGAMELLAVDAPIRLPDGFVPAFAAGGVLTAWLDGCLAVWPRAAWSSLAGRVLALPMTAADARTFERLLFASAVEFELDIVRPRLVVPGGHRDLAGIAERAVLVGAGDHAELWAPDRWARVAGRRLEDLALPSGV